MKTLERLKDDDLEWGLTRIEYGLIARQKRIAATRARRAQYLQRVAIRERNDKGQFIGPSPVENPAIWRVQAQDVQELGIIAVSGEISLPFISILHGLRPT